MSQFKVGDRVVLRPKPTDLETSNGDQGRWVIWGLTFVKWLDDLHAFVGQEGFVVEHDHDDIRERADLVMVRFGEGVSAYQQIVFTDWIEPADRCTCDVFHLLRRGCSCGQFTKEMTNRSVS